VALSVDLNDILYAQYDLYDISLRNTAICSARSVCVALNNSVEKSQPKKKATVSGGFCSFFYSC